MLIFHIDTKKFSMNSLLRRFAQALITLLLLHFAVACNLNNHRLIDAISGASKSLSGDGNSLYHQTDEQSLATGSLLVAGEVEEPGVADLEKLYKRELVMKESTYEEGIRFIGAYRYRGYSLFDLLNSFRQKKKNADTFRPPIDLYIIIENDVGDQVVFSWSEIFHTTIPHQVMIATEMAPIVPYRKEVAYPVSDTWKVIAGNDLLAFRHLTNPVKIIVASFDQKNYPIQRDLKPLYSDQVTVVKGEVQLLQIETPYESNRLTTYESSFFGMGMGNHPADPFEGPQLRTLINEKVDLRDPMQIQKGLVCFAGLDGYRAVYSFSELFNRNDQMHPILDITPTPDEGGYYRIFHPADFFADRSVKSLQEIYFFGLEN